MVGGERKFPNRNTTLCEKLALLTVKEDTIDKKQVHQIAALTFEEQIEVEDTEALNELGEEEREVVEGLLQDYWSGLLEPIYPPPSDLREASEVCLVKLDAETLIPRRIDVAITLQDQQLFIPVMAFADTGSLTNLLNE